MKVVIASVRPNVSEIRRLTAPAVPSGATANIIANANVGNVSAAGATVNAIVPSAGMTFSFNDGWAVNGAIANLNITAPGGGFARFRSNGGSFAANSFLGTAVNLDNVIVWTRTNSFGNTIDMGSLSGTSTAVLSGGGQGGGTFANYSIGSLNTNTTFAGKIDTTSAPTPNTSTDLGGLNLTKVGTGTLNLSGTLSYQPTGNATTAHRGGITTVSEGILKLTNSAAIPGGIIHATAGNVFSTIDVQTSGKLDVTGYAGGTYATQPLQQIVGAGTLVGNWNHSAGVIRPANSLTNFSADSNAVAGTINFNGNLQLSGGEIGYDMSLNPNSGNDLINVTGSVAISGGKIVPNFISGMAPTSGTYTVLTASGGITGSAASMVIEFPGQSAYTASLRQVGNDIVLDIGLAGDYNNNGIVDAADYTIWRDTLGSTTDLRANGDNTGPSADKIDQADFLFWKSHFGVPPGSGSGGNANAAVPEPATLVMFLSGILAMLPRRRAKVS